jgi:hypothetical protein
VLRTASPLAFVAGLTRERARALDPELRVMRVASFAEMREVPLARPRWNALLIGLFGVTALLLTAIGLYAVVGASVRQRSSEIGVRMALGATAADVRRLVLAQALLLAAAAAAIGLGAALAASRVVRSLLFGVHPLDPRRCSAAAPFVGAAALAACFPRAGSRVSPRRSALSEPAQPAARSRRAAATAVTGGEQQARVPVLAVRERAKGERAAALVPGRAGREPFVPGLAARLGVDQHLAHAPGLRLERHHAQRDDGPAEERHRDDVVVDDRLRVAAHPAQLLALFTAAPRGHRLERLAHEPVR